jgi:quercetin dioxygenase-like cupin family protein
MKLWIKSPQPYKDCRRRGKRYRTVCCSAADGKDYILREITLPPHQSTGWHMHKWPLYVLSHFDSTCESDGVYKPGSTISKPANYLHIGRNLDDTPVVLDVLYILDHGGPLSVDEPNPGSDFE